MHSVKRCRHGTKIINSKDLSKTAGSAISKGTGCSYIGSKEVSYAWFERAHIQTCLGN